MKKYPSIIMFSILGVVVLFTGCEEEYGGNEQASRIISAQLDFPPVENLDFEVVDDLEGNPGGGLHLTWETPAGDSAIEYVVSVDGKNQTPVQTTEDYVYTPGMIIGVVAVYSGGESNPEELDFKAVETPSLDVWSVADPSPDHPSGLGFGTSGYASSYATSYHENWPFIDYYIAVGPVLASPNVREPEHLNEENNTSCEEAGTYEDLYIVKNCNQGSYQTDRLINTDDLYGLWLDANDDGYTSDDHFAKAYVIDVQGLKVTFKLAYQTVTGLRWVVTEEGQVGIEED